MECCEGGDFSKYIRTHKKLTEERALYFMKQLANGLKFLRQKQIVHRDLKPQNLLLSDESERPILKIGDFGFAKFIDPFSLSDTFCGSPLYMAPEILHRKNYTVKADLWSVGIILYEMLVGEPAYNSGSVPDLLNQLQNKKIKLPSHISSECQNLIYSLLQIDVEKRISWEDFFNHKWLNLNNSNNYNNNNDSNKNNSGNYFNNYNVNYSNNNNNNNNISYPISINSNNTNSNNNYFNNSPPNVQHPSSLPYDLNNNSSNNNNISNNNTSNNYNNSNVPNSLPFAYNNNIYSSPTDTNLPTLNKSKSLENTGNTIRAHPFKDDKKSTTIQQQPQQQQQQQQQNRQLSNLSTDFERDLVILDGEELESMERVFNRAVAIAELGDLRQNEPLECVPLYLLALKLMKSKIPTDPSSSPDKFINTFTEYKRKLVHIFSTSNTSVKNQDLHSSFSPNRFIYENALEFGKKGAVEELYNNYPTSLQFYTDGTLLLEYLSSIVIDSDDQEIIKKYLNAFELRTQICKKNYENSKNTVLNTNNIQNSNYT
ncbi:hypothetical protein ACTFIV_006264 [Dictyostelium citrinum]